MVAFFLEKMKIKRIYKKVKIQDIMNRLKALLTKQVGKSIIK